MRLALVVLLFFVPLSACNGEETYTWNQRMTVTVETPDGPATGSSVIEVRVAYSESGMGLARDVQFQARHSGEAVAVEVAPEQYLFVPLRVPSSWLYTADPERFGSVGFPDYLSEVRNQSEPFILCAEGQYCPEMLALVERDQFGLRAVSPGALSDVFGEGYSITEVRLEITEAPVTSGAVFEALRWTCTDFDPARPGIRPNLKLRDASPRGWNTVPYLEFTTERFCQQGD